MTRVSAVLVTILLCLGCVPGSAGAAVPTGTGITPEGWDTRDWAQATDAEGDTAYAFSAGSGGTGHLYLRIRRVDGALGPVVELAPTQGYSTLRVAVDRDGDGAVTWLEGLPGSDPAWRLQARRFSRSGELGPLLDLAAGQDPAASVMGARPDGTVVVAWSDVTGSATAGYVPYVRTISPDSTLGPVLRLGDGPNAGPLLAVAPDGETVLVWNELRALKSRRLTTSGRLTPTRRVYRWADLDETGTLEALAVDRRGVAVLAFGRWRPLPPTPLPPPGGNRHERGSYLRIGPDSRPLGKPRYLFPIEVTYDDLAVGVAPDGTAVVGWQENYYAGAWVRRLSRGGDLGPARRIADGGLDEIRLRRDGDGFITASGVDANGYVRVVRVAEVVDGHAWRSRRVAVSGWDASIVRGALLPGGRWLASWVTGPEPGQVRVATGR